MSSTIQIGNKKVGDNHPCFIIAEIGCNHDGKLEQAKKLVDMAAKAGCDAAKFQSFTANKLFNEYFSGYKPGWMDLIKSLELPREWHKELKKYCESKGILFLSSICDEEKVDWLDELDVAAFKVPSYELTHLPLLKYAASKGRPMVLSTGIAIESEIAETLDFIRAQGNEQLAIMHCVSAYPGSIEDLNLGTIPYYKQKFGIPVGLSDHCNWVYSSALAASLGANLIEKHITLDKGMPGPDHSFAIDPNEIKIWVNEIRNAEKALGKVKRGPADGEYDQVLWRRSIFAREDIPAGTRLTAEHLMIVRPSPGGSLPPKEFFSIIGKKTVIPIKQGGMLSLDKIN